VSCAEREPETTAHVHVLPVDLSFGATDDGVLEAWKEICIFGRRVTFTGGETWATLTCHGGCEGIEHEDDADG
jgi:hypothetical protein